MSPHLRAVLQALLVTFLWSTSWILIKIGLAGIPALTFAGLRYTLAFLALLPLAARSGQLGVLCRLPRRRWAELVLLGLLFYFVTQGAQFLSLFYLPATTGSLLLSFTTVIVTLLGIFLLRERPTWQQWAGTALYMSGVLIYFYPPDLPRGQAPGLAIAGAGVLANALSAVLGRYINRRGALTPVAVTTASMGTGALVLLAAGLLVQGLPRLSAAHWLIVLWLALVNSAFAFTLWNHTLRTLPALEASLINNTMLFQIAILAWAFLDEALDPAEIAGIALAALGTLVVQLPARQPGGKKHR